MDLDKVLNIAAQRQASRCIEYSSAELTGAIVRNRAEQLKLGKFQPWHQ
jgi:hypothetical protein